MEKLNEIQKRPFMGSGCIGALARGHACLRILGRKYHTATNRGAAMQIVDDVLSRDNAARVKNVAGKFVITELVMG